MLERTEMRFGMRPASLAADSAYGSAESLAWLVKHKGIVPHIPVFDKSNRTDGTFSRAAFVFDPEHDPYTCPAGKELVQFRRTYAIPRSGVTAEAQDSIAPANWIAMPANSKPSAVRTRSPARSRLDPALVLDTTAATAATLCLRPRECSVNTIPRASRCAAYLILPTVRPFRRRSSAS